MFSIFTEIRLMALSLKMLILDASNDHKSAWFESLILCTITHSRAWESWPQGNWSQVRSNKNWTVCTYCTYFRRIISWSLGLYHSMGQVKIIPGQGVKKFELISNLKIENLKQFENWFHLTIVHCTTCFLFVKTKTFVKTTKMTPCNFRDESRSKIKQIGK